MRKLFVFLGNPGKVYERTRHNSGFRLCDYLYPSLNWQKKFHALYAQQEIKLLKPQTFMNESGISVEEAASFFHLVPEEILVAHDDLELPLGTARLQLGGGLQGHNGLKSIREHLGSDQFARLRIGIGRPSHGSVAQFVLDPFDMDEEIALSVLFPKIQDMLNEINRMPQEITL